MKHNNKIKRQIDISAASVYVGTYRKYTEGSLFGKWLHLSDYSDMQSFHSACAALHKDEEDPEFMFQDFENIPDGLISDGWISDNIFEVLQAIDNMDDDHKKPFFLWCSNVHRNLATEDITDLIDAFKSDYIGQYASEEDFARELLEDSPELSDFAKEYFDYEAYAHDLFCSNYWSEDGYVFYNS